MKLEIWQFLLGAAATLLTGLFTLWQSKQSISSGRQKDSRLRLEMILEQQDARIQELVEERDLYRARLLEAAQAYHEETGSTRFFVIIDDWNNGKEQSH